MRERWRFDNYAVMIYHLCLLIVFNVYEWHQNLREFTANCRLEMVFLNERMNSHKYEDAKNISLSSVDFKLRY